MSAVALLSIMAAAPTAVAAPTQPTSTATEEIPMGRMVNGTFVAISEEEIRNATATLLSQAQNTPVTPQLIDWNQWFGCFSQNHSDDVFASYTHYWDGSEKIFD